MRELVEDLKIANDNLYCANKMLEKDNKRLQNIIKEVREEIRILESNCDISDYQAQKLYNLLDKDSDKND